MLGASCILSAGMFRAMLGAIVRSVGFVDVAMLWFGFSFRRHSAHRRKPERK
jgi:hypothetical protein